MKDIYVLKEDNTIDWELHRLEEDDYVCEENEVDKVLPNYYLAKWDSTKKEWYEAGQAPTATPVELTDEEKLKVRVEAIESALINLI